MTPFGIVLEEPAIPVENRYDVLYVVDDYREHFRDDWCRLVLAAFAKEDDRVHFRDQAAFRASGAARYPIGSASHAKTSSLRYIEHDDVRRIGCGARPATTSFRQLSRHIGMNGAIMRQVERPTRGRIGSFGWPASAFSVVFFTLTNLCRRW